MLQLYQSSLNQLKMLLEHVKLHLRYLLLFLWKRDVPVILMWCFQGVGTILSVYCQETFVLVHGSCICIPILFFN